MCAYFSSQGGGRGLRRRGRSIQIPATEDKIDSQNPSKAPLSPDNLPPATTRAFPARRAIPWIQSRCTAPNILSSTKTHRKRFFDVGVSCSCNMDASSSQPPPLPPPSPSLPPLPPIPFPRPLPPGFIASIPTGNPRPPPRPLPASPRSTARLAWDAALARRIDAFVSLGHLSAKSHPCRRAIESQGRPALRREARTEGMSGSRGPGTYTTRQTVFSS